VVDSIEPAAWVWMVCSWHLPSCAGQRAEVRIGYIGSAAHTYLNPASAALRRHPPEAKVKLLPLIEAAAT